MRRPREQGFLKLAVFVVGHDLDHLPSEDKRLDESHQQILRHWRITPQRTRIICYSSDAETCAVAGERLL
jgi:hypothetical protein